ncbi:MAG: molybdopterin cofactor-binding domain-containing protein, partial [Gammaproteobacteria bacterium]
MSEVLKLGRRALLRAGGSTAAVLVLGVRPFAARAAEAPDSLFRPGAFVAIDADGRVTITVSRSEMGQGVRTSLPRIVADELEASLERVLLLQGDGDPRYGDQNTDGSKSVRLMFDALRH